MPTPRYSVFPHVYNFCPSALNGKSLMDVGAGGGKYVQFLQRAGVDAYGFDATEQIEQLTRGLVTHWDPSEGTSPGRTFDFLLMIEVVDLIADERVPMFLQNLDQHVTAGIVLTSRSETILNLISKHTSWQIQAEVSHELRNAAELDWLRESIFFFSKDGHESVAGGLNQPHQAAVPQQQPQQTHQGGPMNQGPTHYSQAAPMGTNEPAATGGGQQETKQQAFPGFGTTKQTINGPGGVNPGGILNSAPKPFSNPPPPPLQASPLVQQPVQKQGEVKMTTKQVMQMPVGVRPNYFSQFVS